VGDAAFDEMFVVGGLDAEEVRVFLSDPHLRQELMTQARHLPDFQVFDATLSTLSMRLLTDADTMIVWCESAARMVLALEQRQGHCVGILSAPSLDARRSSGPGAGTR
jgi:hypothetical protein